jgi:hypothetical protein
MMLSIAVLFLIQATSAPAPIAPTDSGDPPDRVARLAVLQGSVFFQPSGDTSASSWSDASINYPLTSGDRLYADQGGRAELQVGDCTLRINGVADLTVATLTDDFLQLSLAQGRLQVSVYDLSAGDSIEVDTPNGALLLRREGSYRIDVSESGNATTVAVERGLADVIAGDAVQALHGGSALRLDGYDLIRVSSVSPPAPDDFDRWCAERDGALGSSVSAQYVGRDVPGYADLDRYGRWETEPDYGPVWYPTGVIVGWAPYRYGHWVWVDPWGWTWLDDTPWGFVPFHYGRWVWLRSRWAWVPGRWPHRPCYAPALVVFVSVGRVGVQAWFPLGPGEPYHPWYHHGPRYRGLVNPGIVVVPTRQVKYMNRPRTIVVPISVVQRGDPVGRRAVPATGPEATRAQPIAHPRVSPLPRAAGGGQPAARPPTVRRPAVEVQPWRRPTEARPAPAQRPPRRVISRNPPARQALPFPTRERAMRPEPGWPLEPQQRQNLRAGKPAGPHRDTQEPPRSATPRTRQPAKKPPPKKP